MTWNKLQQLEVRHLEIISLTRSNIFFRGHKKLEIKLKDGMEMKIFGSVYRFKHRQIFFGVLTSFIMER